MLDEEVEALKSIYCLPGECSLVAEREVTINLKVPQLSQDDAFTDVKVVIDVTDEYPNVIPDVSLISSGLKREHITDIKSKVIDSCKELIGQPMLVSMVTLIQEDVEKKANLFKSMVTDVNEQSVDLKSSANSTAGDTWTALLHIDHMRSKTKYCKHLERWTKELNLTGRLMFCKRLILVLLQGTRPNIKEFIVRLRTVSVDVDSRGQSCKEKMMTILAEEPSSSPETGDYQVLELLQVAELQSVFIDNGLGNMYKKYVSDWKGFF